MARCNENQTPVRLFFALMTRLPELFEECEETLAEEFGPVDLRGEIYEFDEMTEYYAKEFGAGLRKKMISVGRLIALEDLVVVKRRTNEIEDQMARRAAPGVPESPRVVNIDPGYLSLSKVVLATTKDNAHRLYMGRGIFEEVTLTFRRRSEGYEPNPWTYKDYRDPARLEFFNRLRGVYGLQLRGLA
jgi:hypothetical protein